ncbi:MAG TPA: long-chain fatty acid--CoA ligase [Longimicrobiales bacterium]|nr:long-chain fatty acid--CoA ligase [Longimicrobiales bacterium]
MLNLSTFVEHNARMTPDRVAVVQGERRMTYGELDALACRVANGLRQRGLRPGDRVALSCPNLPYFPVVYYGILKAGCIVVPLNVLLKGAEVAYHLEDSVAAAYFCFEGTPALPMLREGLEGFSQAAECRHLFVLPADPRATQPIEGVEPLASLIADQPTTFATEPTGTDDTAVILYTSGTTGRPKGAELTHANLWLNAVVTQDLVRSIYGAGETMTTLVALPLFHSFGQTVQMNAGLYGGGTLVLMPRFEPGAVLETIVREDVTHFAGVPTMYWAILEHARRLGADTAEVARHLRICCSGGAALPVELLRAFEETFGVVILEGYGLSETAPVATFNQIQRPRKPGSIGLPVMGVDVRVVDAGDRDVVPGQAGEILIRGHNVMKGYWRNPEATAEAMRGGWFHTGDIARRDEEGYLYIVDRVKDLIIRGGFNVYPREVEELMATHPAVSLVAVVGVPHEALGEEVVAYVVPRAGAEVTEDDLVAWCREHMAAYKYPRHIEFRDSLPMTATGKILKTELRAEARAAARAP